jgi:hypothetical protein
MKPISRYLLRNIDSFIAATAAFFLIQLLGRHSGIGISPDSVTYLSVARNLHSTGSLVDFNHDPLVVFPCFYPVFLSFVLLLSTQLVSFMPVINGLLFGILIFLSGRMMDRFSIPSRIYKSVLLTCFVLSPCLLEVYSMLWSETIFLILLLVFFIGLKRYLENHTLTSLIFISIIAGIACITRYAGVTLIGLGGVLILTDNKKTITSRLSNAFMFALISCIPPTVNLIRNHYTGGTLTGFREKSNISFRHIMDNYGIVFRDWLPFFGKASSWAICIGVAIIIGFAVAAFFVFKSGKYTSYENIAIVFFLLYAIFIIGGATISRFEEINSRLLSPCFIPLLWGVTAWMPRWTNRSKGVVKMVSIGLPIVIAVLFQANQLAADYETWDGVKDAGIPGYTEDDWTQSSIVQYIQENKQLFNNAVVYANANDAFYFYTGLPCRFLPHKESGREKELFQGTSGKWIVWFDAGDNADLVNLIYLQITGNLKLVHKFEDGRIYYISP